MAKGYPDFFGYSFFPTYGDIITSSFDDTISSVGALNLVSLSMKGQIFSGAVHLIFANIPNVSFLQLLIDGQQNFTIDPATIFTKYRYADIDLPLSVVSWRKTDLEMVVKIKEGIPFNSTVLLRYVISSGNYQIDIDGQLSYYQVRS